LGRTAQRKKLSRDCQSAKVSDSPIKRKTVSAQIYADRRRSGRETYH
jgi:hypothetical protein